VSDDEQREFHDEPATWTTQGFHAFHGRLERIEHKIDQLLRMETEMAIDQATFDTDLAALVTALGTLTSAVDALIASKPAADLTAEDQSVQAASQSVSDELAKLNPTPAPAA
jgi:hypothetical protein